MPISVFYIQTYILMRFVYPEEGIPSRVKAGVKYDIAD